MRKVFSLFLFLFCIGALHAQHLVPPSTTTYSHDSDCSIDQGVNDSIIVIQMEDGFSDSMKIVVDGKVIKEGFFRSDYMQSTHQEFFLRRSSDHIDIITGGSGVHIILDQHYKYLAISRISGQWVLCYSDCAIVHG
ncbi:MAG TPA: hypothetical protein VL651_16250 [Bacteroidia bacterium]|nr:hypothetical protein [Bacteroidia bacterium]